LIPDGIQGFTEQHQAFLFHVDHSTPTLDLPARGSTYIDEERHGDIAFFFFSPDVNPITAFDTGTLVRRSPHHSVDIQFFAVGLPGDAAKCGGP
jgi:hypothetical protein